MWADLYGGWEVGDTIRINKNSHCDVARYAYVCGWSSHEIVCVAEGVTASITDQPRGAEFAAAAMCVLLCPLVGYGSCTADASTAFNRVLPSPPWRTARGPPLPALHFDRFPQPTASCFPPLPRPPAGSWYCRWPSCPHRLWVSATAPACLPRPTWKVSWFTGTGAGGVAACCLAHGKGVGVGCTSSHIYTFLRSIQGCFACI